MNLPPDAPRERRHLPRHIRDGEHELLHDTGEAAANGAAPRRLRRVLVYVLLIAAVVAGLWFYNGTR